MFTRMRASAADIASSLTQPLPFDVYARMIDPLWSRSGSETVRARVVDVIAETARASTIVLQPGRGWKGHVPGQWVEVGVDINGVRHRRCYSLTSVPRSADGLITITSQRLPEGIVSGHLTQDLERGAIVHLSHASGEFVLPDSVGPTLFLTGGSGITPVMGMLRTADAGGVIDDVVMLHHAQTADEVIFADELAGLASRHAGLTVTVALTGPGVPPPEASLHVERLDRECPDWRARDVWACGPGPMLDAATEIWQAEGLAERLHLESFRPPTMPVDPDAAGGRVRFTVSDTEVDAAPNEPILLAAERAGLMPKSGCRMGICRSCVKPLSAGTVTDLRDGRMTSEPGTHIQICVNTATGDVDVAL